MSKTVNVNTEIVASVKTAILSHFESILSELDANPAQKHCALQFRREMKHYQNDAFIAAFVDALALKDAGLFDFMMRVEQTQKRVAIYAMQKVTRLLRALSNSYARHHLDKYTNAILANARKTDNAIGNYDQRASICRDLRVSDDTKLVVRLHCADSTASTQRSSSSIALHALGLAVYDRESRTLAFTKKAANARSARKLLDSFATEGEVEEAITAEA